MPCYDSRNNEPRYIDKPATEAFENAERTARDLKDKNDFLEGAMCALMSELKRQGSWHTTCQEASRKGKIDIVSWAVKHESGDRFRLYGDLHNRYSVDELQNIKALFDNDEIF